ncbi:MAG: ATPase [Euryarchaeota archaeon CG01_land_8_20_14_3_00_38_12]|nr:MAG: ATPase [Euryarchaeota archaeon CG01_land_8_20_14_3_00_38_12]PJB21187.1 MAG: ATPase [Euryarchaeota archaeon CG_4_9_14_3_um_filter_38_12]
MVITIISVDRKEVGNAKKIQGYLLIYGRRKVGKTYLVKNFLGYDVYFLVKRGGGILAEGVPLSKIDSFDQFIELTKSLLKDGKTVVVDEFQRLPGEFLDYVQSFHPHGRLILTGSSFHIVKEILSSKSPILGLFSELKLSLLSASDIFTALSKRMNEEKSFELAPYLRDAWTLRYFKHESTRIEEILLFSKGAIRSLLGEVFLEEERSLSAVYEGLIRSLSIGKWRFKEVSDLLHSRGLIPRADPSLIRPYFNNMEEMDLVTKIPLYKTKNYKYIVKSPIMETGFLLDEKLNLFEEDIPEKRIKEMIDKKIPSHIEIFCGQIFAELYDGRFEYSYSKDFDIDFIITSGKKTLACGEVKWSSSPSKEDVYMFLNRTEHIHGDKIFFSKKEINIDGVISLTPEKLLKLIKEKKEKVDK